jgi:HipA-like protein
MLKSIKKYLPLNFSKKTDATECLYENINLNSHFLLKYQNDTIGHLSYDGEKWTFIYSDWFKNQKELEYLFEFPDTSKKYKNESLWPFFASRIPSNKQPKVQDFYENNPSEKNNIVKLLAEFGKTSINNPFKLTMCL